MVQLLPNDAKLILQSLNCTVTTSPRAPSSTAQYVVRSANYILHYVSSRAVIKAPNFACHVIQVNYCSRAYNAGLRSKDYIVEINGTVVFGMNHEECKELIKRAGNHMVLRVER